MYRAANHTTGRMGLSHDMYKPCPLTPETLVRVLPSYQKRGVGIHLIERMLRQLDCDRPHCTVAEEMLHQFARPFVNHFDFDLSCVDKGLYRPGKLEYVFNTPRQGGLA